MPLHERDAVPVLEIRPSLDTASDASSSSFVETSDSSPQGGALGAVVTVDAEGAWKGHVARSLGQEFNRGGALLTPLVVRIERV